MLTPEIRPVSYDAIEGRSTIALCGSLVLANSLNLALPVVLANGQSVLSDVIDARGFPRFWIAFTANGAGVRIRFRMIDPVDEVTAMFTMDPGLATAAAATPVAIQYDPLTLNAPGGPTVGAAHPDLIQVEFNNNSGAGRQLTGIGTMLFSS